MDRSFNPHQARPQSDHPIPGAIVDVFTYYVTRLQNSDDPVQVLSFAKFCAENPWTWLKDRHYEKFAIKSTSMLECSVGLKRQTNITI